MGPWSKETKEIKNVLLARNKHIFIKSIIAVMKIQLNYKYKKTFTQIFKHDIYNNYQFGSSWNILYHVYMEPYSVCRTLYSHEVQVGTCHWGLMVHEHCPTRITLHWHISTGPKWSIHLQHNHLIYGTGLKFLNKSFFIQHQFVFLNFANIPQHKIIMIS